MLKNFKFGKFMGLLVCVAVICTGIFALTSCEIVEEPDATATPYVSEEPGAATDAVTEAPTEEPTDVPTATPTATPKPTATPTATAKATATPKPTIDPSKVGLNVTNKKDLVGICYTMWFDAYLGKNFDGTYKYNVSEMLENYSFSSANGFTDSNGKSKNKENSYYYWGKPAQGYYSSTDADAHRNNLELIGAAGVDYLILDYTYTSNGGFEVGTSGWTTYVYKPTYTLLNTIVKMREEGKTVPYVVFWVNNDLLFDALNKYFFSRDAWADCFVYWNDKPFVLVWNYKSQYANNEMYTIKGMNGLQYGNGSSDNQWSYLEQDNSLAASSTHIGVAVAAQRTYMSDTSTASGRQGGKFWYNQWKNAFDKHPKFVTVAWWNEWGAQLFHINGQWVFTDNYNQEYSRDIEPMEGGHGDQYYKWLCSYVKAYKAHEECPKNYN